MRDYIKLTMILILITSLSTLFAVSADDLNSGGNGGTKVRDHSTVHNFGNIWLRVSNYGFFGSGSNEPQWPSLEFPGGSGIDYLYQGALWFGAKKVRRDDLGRKIYWLHWPPEGDEDIVAEGDEGWSEDLKVVIDTLTSVGFDGDLSLYELLPSYNPLEPSYLGTQYTQYNYRDVVMETSIRDQRKGVDDDGDGLIDEDPVGWAFPFREAEELPDVFEVYGGDFLANSQDTWGTAIIEDDLNQSIWFPLGFVELSDQSNELYLFTEPNDDDGDGVYDEDGYPVSEQDFISYYYDYSPFPNGNPDPDRDYGASSGSNTHVPLNIRVRQLSYQWSYEYIQNLVYVEFDITNMNITYGDTLFDCAMGIYIDSDVGPQAWGGTEIAGDDLSSYVPGSGYEFAYTWDADFDGGLTQGYVGSRVCTPDPDSLEFACWTWTVGAGPDDNDPLNYDGTSNVTANQKYWLLTGRNSDPGESSDYTSLRDEPDAQSDENPQGVDTRYLFAFYGDMQGMAHYDDDPETNPTSGSWNLEPGKTMKIVIAVFPGYTLPELRRTSGFAKMIYGQSQTLTTVVEPDIFIHYEAPEPPDYPKMYAGLVDKGNTIEVYWDNRSEFSIDPKFVPQQVVGYQEEKPELDSYYTGDMDDYADFPEQFKPQFDDEGDLIININAEVNPWTAYRLRHDFQGYALYGRSGSGSQEDWEEKGRWDKLETDQDFEDFMVNFGLVEYADYGGYLGIGDINSSLPDQAELTDYDLNYYKQNDLYELVPYDPEVDQYVYGKPIYDWEMTNATVPENVYELSYDDQALLFMSDDLRDLGSKGEQIFLTIYSSNLIPLYGFIPDDLVDDPVALEEIRGKRLSRRYYKSQIQYPPKGIEYYVAMTAWDRGMPANSIESLESGRDAKANMKIIFPGPDASTDMDEIYVVPNPYIGHSMFDGKREDDVTYEKSRRLWFVKLPENCMIKIYTLAGDLVDTIKHNGGDPEDVISISKAMNINSDFESDFTATGIEPWDLLSKNNQIIAPGVYLFSVKDNDSGDIKVGKFVIIK